LVEVGPLRQLGSGPSRLVHLHGVLLRDRFLDLVVLVVVHRLQPGLVRLLSVRQQLSRRRHLVTRPEEEGLDRHLLLDKRLGLANSSHRHRQGLANNNNSLHRQGSASNNKALALHPRLQVDLDPRCSDPQLSEEECLPPVVVVSELWQTRRRVRLRCLEPLQRNNLRLGLAAGSGVDLVALRPQRRNNKRCNNNRNLPACGRLAADAVINVFLKWTLLPL